MVRWIFPLHFSFSVGGGFGKLKSLTVPENVAVTCNWLSPLRVTGGPVGFSRVDFDETMIAYQAVGCLLQMLVTQLQHKRMGFVSGKSQKFYLPFLFPGLSVIGVDLGHWGEARSGCSLVSRHFTKTTNFKIWPLI